MSKKGEVLGKFTSEDGASLTPAERQFVEGIRRLMPGYRFEMSYFAKNRRKRDAISSEDSSSESGRPSASRSESTA